MRVSVSRRVGGISALLGGAAWAVKSASILVTGWQPPLLFELALPLFGVAVVGLASEGARGRRRGLALVLGVVATLAGAVALLTEVVGVEADPSIAVATASVLLALVIVGLGGRRAPGGVGAAARLALVIGLATVPAVLLGGFLELVAERLLELPLLGVACLWLWLGVLVLRGHRPRSRAGRTRAAIR